MSRIDSRGQFDPVNLSWQFVEKAGRDLLIAREKPALRSEIVEALRNVDVSIYGDSMRPLVCEDISAALLEIEGMQ